MNKEELMQMLKEHGFDTLSDCMNFRDEMYMLNKENPGLFYSVLKEDILKEVRK